VNLSLPKFRMRWFITPIGLAVVGLGVCALGAIIPASRDQFLRAWLFGWLCVLGVTLGAMAWLFIHHLTGGAWGYMTRRISEAAAMTLPLVLVAGLPLVFGASHVFPWADAHHVEKEALLRHRAVFFGPGMVLARTLVFFALWILIAWGLRVMSLRHDRTGEPGLLQRMHTVAVIGLLVYFVTMSVTAFDLICSREVEWYSSTFGVVTVLGQASSGICVMILALSQLRRQPAVAAIVTPDRVHDLGNMLLASTVLWSYVSFAQYLIIWIGNTQEDVTWFYLRSKTAWGIVGGLIMLCHFGVPFVILLWQNVKRDLTKLSVVALWILVMRFVDNLWMVAPTNYPLHGPHDPTQLPHAASANWLDPFALIGLGGAWAALFIWILARRPLVPRAYHDQFEVLLNQGSHHGEDSPVGTHA
jgi:hypothetical protein